MNRFPKQTQTTVSPAAHGVGRIFIGLLAVMLVLLYAPVFAKNHADQVVFSTPDEAASMLVKAISDKDGTLLGKLLGSRYKTVLPLDNVDEEDVKKFLVAWEEHHALLPQGDKKMLIAVGEEKWIFPIPIIADNSGWRFDIEKGLERMRIRNIGRNELATIQAVLAYYDAQMEYAEVDRNGDGILEYAQRFISTSGSHDGLYWSVDDGETLSPLGPLLGDHTPGGGYHGYFFRILTAQDKHAKGGAYSYLMNDRLRVGFALIAWPVEYGETGVMSFMINHDGIIYEKDLGPDGGAIGKKMSAFDPDPGWTPVKEASSPQ